MRLILDRSVRLRRAGRVLVGGDPPRAIRLTGAGAAVLDALRRADAVSPAAEALSRRLTDAGLAHPVPEPDSTTAVTVVIPVRDRVEELDRCLASAGGPVLVIDDGSRDGPAVSAVCARHRVRVVRVEASRGPAAARNAALAHVDTPLIAFLDSDCVAPSGWLAALAGQFVDPLVAAVAPRVQGLADPCDGPVGRYAAARSPLDLGAAPARVIPGGRVSYVPTAALLVRRAALGDGFDPALRYGEDVDLVWRLHDAGWRVRYDPSVTVAHREPARLRALVTRRYRYGTSAAPLAARHPGRLSPFVAHPSPTTVVGLALVGRPRTAAFAALVQTAVIARNFRRTGIPVDLAAEWAARGAVQTLLALARATTSLAPAALAAAVTHRRTRPAAIALLAAAPAVEWATRRPPLDPLRWTFLHVLDDVAYGAGVWAGSLRCRTVAPVLPRWSRRSRASRG